MGDDPFGILETYEREAAERAALPYFVTYEPNPCPLCGRIRWQRMSDGVTYLREVRLA